MNLFKFLLGSKANLASLPVKLGNLLVASSESNGHELYTDSGSERLKLGYSTKEIDVKIADALKEVDGVTITDFGNKLAVISTEESLPSTVIRTQASGKISEDLFRSLRDKKASILLRTDKFLLSDYPIDEANLLLVKEYRKAVRDLPAQPGAPWDGGGEDTPWPPVPAFVEKYM